MRWFKLLDAEDTIVGAEAHEEPAFVCRQKNGVIVNCEERKAQGLCSADGSVLYDFGSRGNLGEDAEALAVEIDWQEYNSIVHELPDPEDEVEPGDGDVILTRAELTAEVTELKEMNLMLVKMLLDNREDSMKASKSYCEGDLIVVGNKLYKALVRIASGAVLTVGTNVKQTTVAAEIAAVNS